MTHAQTVPATQRRDFRGRVVSGVTLTTPHPRRGETTRDVVNGNGNTWGYRGWVMNGVDASCTQQTGRGINIWDRGPTRPQRIPGQLGSWGWVGSNHPQGANITLGDGSVRFISQVTDLVTLTRLSRIADGLTIGDY